MLWHNWNIFEGQTKRDSIAAQDYFIFSRGMYLDMPPFMVGRLAFDNWIVGYAKINKDTIIGIDASKFITVFHIEHERKHAPEFEKQVKENHSYGSNIYNEGGNVHDLPYKLDSSGTLYSTDYKCIYRS